MARVSGVGYPSSSSSCAVVYRLPPPVLHKPWKMKEVVDVTGDD
jgi:hypothetical protein